MYASRRTSLPVVEAPREIAGRSCESALDTARELTKNAALERARLAYLWLATHCDDSAVLPDALLEGGSLLGYLMQRPREAQRLFEEFLDRFPARLDAGVALYHLAKLEIDSGDYAAAVAHLKLLSERYPNSPREQSAKFLAVIVGEMLAAERRSQRTFLGQIAATVPTNFLSFLALLTALGPALVQAASKARRRSANSGTRFAWVIPSVVIGLTLLNYVVNNIDSARRNRMLMEELNQLSEARAHR